MSNYSAGIADPYWYEWSIGLLYALDMLNPDNNIKHIILQANNMQGLDDVIIEYNNGEAKCIQVKHTRINNSLTFSDLVYPSGKNKSLLYKLSSDWKNSGYKNCEAILFTNRTIGERKSTSQNDKYVIPPLNEFINQINKQVVNAKALSDIKVREDWQDAWDIWLNELSALNTDEEKIKFLCSFKVLTNQGELDDIFKLISDKLTKYFKVNIETVVQLEQKLCYALKSWTISSRTKEEITVEDLYSALSLSSDKIIGKHDLITCEPFFSSRVEFVKSLEQKLINREAPVIFLYGDPGSGKTNIVNYLANKKDSVIKLRFHAFKPLSVEDLYFTVDEGISDAKALWGNLLVGLRKWLTGKLAKYNVPVSIELLDSIDDIRDEVIRLSNVLANETREITVIAIDGIDHAARSGSANNFLRTLLPPERVPENVCFLIVGQPTANYDAYPDWLSDSEQVLHIEVPSITESDIKQLISVTPNKINEVDFDIAAKIINKVVAGNTLSAVFAIYELRHCNDLDELEIKLNKSKLSYGIQAYYEYIWKEMKDRSLPNNIDIILSGVLAFINKKITPKLLTEIFTDLNINAFQWELILSKLYPLVIKENEGYRVFHNDVRLYLESYIRKEKGIFKIVTSRLATYFLEESTDLTLKHQLGFQLLKYAQRENEYIKYFNEWYVVEAIKQKRPMTEILDQLSQTLKSVEKLEDYKYLLSLSCSIDTLYQYINSLQWIDQEHEFELKIPIALECEKKILSKKLFNIDVINSLFSDVFLLIDNNQLDRAKKLINNWFEGIYPEELAELLRQDEPSDLTKLQLFDYNSKIDKVIKTWGQICRAIKITYEKKDASDVTEEIKNVRATFMTGWLKESGNIRYLDNKEIEFTLGNMDYYFIEDIEDFFSVLLDNNKNKYIELLYKNDINEFSCYTKVKFVAWALINNKKELVKPFIEEIMLRRFHYLIIKEHERFEGKVFEGFAIVLFILSYCEKLSFGNPSNLVKDCLYQFSGKDFTYEKRGYFPAYSLLNSCRILGEILYNFHTNNEHLIHENEIQIFVNGIFNRSDPIGYVQIGGSTVQRFLLKTIVDMDHYFSNTFRNDLISFISINVKKWDTLPNLDLWWNYLRINKYEDILREVYDYWMGEKGKIWEAELHDIKLISSTFIPKAKELGWYDEVNRITELLESKLIGYVGRKDYSLFNPLEFYKSLDYKNIPYWKTIGLQLLNISKYASETGENEAAIDIKSIVASSAGCFGPKALWEFAMSNPKWDEEWVQTIFDGVICSLENQMFSEQELLSIWSLASKLFYVKKDPRPYDSANEIRRSYISDIKIAILLASNRLGFVDVENKMKKIAEFEFSQNRVEPVNSILIIPKRWYDESELSNIAKDFFNKHKDMNPKEILELLKCTYINEPKSFYWEIVVGFIKKVEQTSDDITFFISEILNLLRMDRNTQGWEFNNTKKIYYTIFKYLKNHEVKEILNDIVNNFLVSDQYSDYSKLFYLHNNINVFLLGYYMNLSEVDKLEAVKRKLQMHINWITGYGKLQTPIFYNFYNLSIENFTWIDFCEMLYEKVLS